MVCRAYIERKKDLGTYVTVGFLGAGILQCVFDVNLLFGYESLLRTFGTGRECTMDV